MLPKAKQEYFLTPYEVYGQIKIDIKSDVNFWVTE